MLRQTQNNPAPLMLPRRRIVEVNPEWLRPRKGDGQSLLKAKRRMRELTAPLGSFDDSLVMAGKLVEQDRQCSDKLPTSVSPTENGRKGWTTCVVQEHQTTCGKLSPLST